MDLLHKSDKFFLAGSNGMAGRAIYSNLIANDYGNPLYGGSILCPVRSQLDLRNQSQVEEWMRKNRPDIVIIAAATVGGIDDNKSRPVEFFLDNIKIQTNIIESAFRYKVRRLLFLGSSCIYPRNCPQPIKEEMLLTNSLESTNEAYALAKIGGIRLIHYLNMQYKCDYISLMPTNLYGEGDNYHPTRSHVLPALIRKFQEAKDEGLDEVTCWGTGSPMREFMHTKDLASACLFALQNWTTNSPSSLKNQNGQVMTHLNVGTGSDISIRDLANMVAREVGFFGRIKWDISKPDGTPKKLLDVSRINNLGWKSSINLEVGLKQAVEDFKARRKIGTLRE